MKCIYSLAVYLFEKIYIYLMKKKYVIKYDLKGINMTIYKEF